MKLSTFAKLVGLIVVMSAADAQAFEPCPVPYTCDYGDPLMGMQGVGSCNENQCDGICKGACGESSDYIGGYSCFPCEDGIILVCACSQDTR